ncbi:acyl-CoA synthetase [Natrinema halophilum]|uniref:acyl-CoA synthetase n=1 Tax=Natrinema halophilum TaxID=1699371 RepID=UPI001F22C1C7|nr:AMP-binding protein [Natrinema halophilum]UHQ96311.1 AMP-binding protein [Natrinema halophilum]
MSNIVNRDEPYFFEREFRNYEHLHDEFEWEIPDQFNIAEYACDRWAADEGERDAIYLEDADGSRATYTYKELEDAANRLANVLTERGIETGDCVGIIASQQIETIISHLATWKIGAVSVPLSTLFGPEALEYRLSDCDATACIVDEDNIDNLREVAAGLDDLSVTLTVGDVTPTDGETAFWNVVEEAAPTFETTETDAEDNALIVYTSGTTGNPKGVVHAHRYVIGALTGFSLVFCNGELHDDDIFWTPSDWAWIGSLLNPLLGGLIYGRKVLAYNGGSFDPEVAFSLMSEYQITGAFFAPTALRMMRKIDDPTEQWDLTSTRSMIVGGELVGEGILDWVQMTFGGDEDIAVHNGYGLTEAQNIVAETAAFDKVREDSMGVPMPGHNVRILDPETAKPTVDRGDVGEIAIQYEGDPVCMKEYLNKPEKTSATIKNGWFLTGDLGVQDEDGYFYFHSRKDDIIISSGYKIGPEEIEDTLASHDAVVDAGVVGVPDDERGHVPKAFIVLTDKTEPSTEVKSSLKSFVKDRLAKYEYPRDIEFVDELPMTASGKIKRAKLREHA